MVTLIVAQGAQLIVALAASVVGAVVLHGKNSKYDPGERKLTAVNPLKSRLEHGRHCRGLDPVPDCVAKTKAMIDPTQMPVPSWHSPINFVATSPASGQFDARGFRSVSSKRRHLKNGPRLEETGCRLARTAGRREPSPPRRVADRDPHASFREPERFSKIRRFFFCR